jgi:hypothetical protein
VLAFVSKTATGGEAALEVVGNSLWRGGTGT